MRFGEGQIPFADLSIPAEKGSEDIEMIDRFLRSFTLKKCA